MLAFSIAKQLESAKAMDLNNPVAGLTNSQIDKLGQRLKNGLPSEADLTLLAAYRNGFALPAKAVFDVARELSGLQPTIRSEKTTLSVVAKLKREGIRLSQMQDISGCRVTVENLGAWAAEGVRAKIGPSEDSFWRFRSANIWILVKKTTKNGPLRPICSARPFCRPGSYQLKTCW